MDQAHGQLNQLKSQLRAAEARLRSEREQRELLSAHLVRATVERDQMAAIELEMAQVRDQLL